ncbi:response regulator transcription factor [Priestia endophytica]|uniref:DNA-binding response regulator, OmpR family, contains REC and winged-helix (WHTH) domain n=1 Tax=Priestia endophytica DSM 13796 TaxID=1121089 RepID=A0A1I6BDH8_9BACI|nr:response regulator transcription factor [Priestia endophytica]KYG26223.1 PhoP family transcriptional regulator [Priestia endophytica]MBG9813845.1 PhoP family transcriptional regulator [Priestia endophytica]SFQ79000.1 DNA-binding response regulator, OmpR family, contains REC and winged-helix (wHTH) domain [Priestia endophytica DSM 13796]
MSHRILIVEDDQFISDMVNESLTKEGFEVTAAFDGEEALELLNTQTFDVILLDLMLPKIDGMECLRMIRSKSMVPVLIMSAKDEDVDKALGLGLGADDYISKPFSMLEVLARIKATIRRERYYKSSQAPKAEKEERKNKTVRIGDLSIDIEGFSVKKLDKKINLTAKEFNILKLLVSNPSQVYTKSQLYKTVWEDDYHGDENVINVHIRRLREKIEDNPSHPNYITTLWGIGYKLGDL